ncbi:hypothetical protein G6F22_021596 [Rhizopus arrhizus]|nr:hypothetical protein G6F22_021596 [Rhizopus arrhizus]
MVRHARDGRQHRLAGVPGAAGWPRRTAGRPGAHPPLPRHARSARPLRTRGPRPDQDAGLRRRALRD